MNATDNVALVRRPPSALEKAEPGAKRILSGRIADAVALARRQADELKAIFQRALEFAQRGEHGQAFEFYRQGAEKGHLHAQYKLGRCYLHGEGVTQSESAGIAWLEKALERGLWRAGFALGNYFHFLFLPNYGEAIKYYQRAVDLGGRGAENVANILERLGKARETPEVLKSAEQGDVEACYEMGQRCLEGLGVTQNAIEAFRWFREAAEQGENADAWCYMGFMLESGHGTPANVNEAIECFHSASELGSDVAHSRLTELARAGFAEAQYYLAYSYTDSDKSEHVKWLKKAAEQGHEASQIRLSIINYMGGYLRENQKDIIESYKWARILAVDKDGSPENVENIKQEMTPDEIEKGEALAREYWSKAYFNH